MSIALSDASRQLIVSFRRTGSEVFVDTWVDGVARETKVSPTDLEQLSRFLGDLASTEWSEPAPSHPASVPATRPTSSPDSDPVIAGGRSGPLPPYPQAARWVPAPSGGLGQTGEPASSE